MQHLFHKWQKKQVYGNLRIVTSFLNSLTDTLYFLIGAYLHPELLYCLILDFIFRLLFADISFRRHVCPDNLRQEHRAACTQPEQRDLRLVELHKSDGEGEGETSSVPRAGNDPRAWVTFTCRICCFLWILRVRQPDTGRLRCIANDICTPTLPAYTRRRLKIDARRTQRKNWVGGGSDFLVGSQLDDGYSPAHRDQRLFFIRQRIPVVHLSWANFKTFWDKKAISKTSKKEYYARVREGKTKKSNFPFLNCDKTDEWFYPTAAALCVARVPIEFEAQTLGRRIN